MKRAIRTFILSLVVLCSFSAANKLYSTDFTFTLTPAVNIPLQEDIPYGFTGIFQSDLNLFGFMTLGLEANYSIFKPNGFVKPMQLFGGGVDLGLYFYPLSRLYTGIGGSFGANSGVINIREDGGVYNTYNPFGLYYRGFAELGFRFSPQFILTVNGGYLAYVKTDFSNFNNGIYAGVGIKMNKSTGSKRQSKAVTVTLDQYDDINPSFSRIYRDNECGIITLTNHESAEIRNVHVYFDGEKYTNSIIECTFIKKLNRYKKEQIPLYIDFSDAIMTFTEDGLIPGSIIIEYELLGQKRHIEHSVSLKVRNRNAFMWSDPAALSTFISSETPEIQNFAKSIAGVARNQLATGMNRNFQFAAAMFVALRCAAINYSEDTLTPFVEYHNSDEVDSILYPLQTMECLGGDFDDLGILLMSLLESQGISCSYMAVDNDFIVFVDLAMKAGSVGNHFANEASVYVDYDADKVYLALSMANFEKGFTTSRLEGAAAVTRALEDEEGDYEFISVEDAWTVYKPVAFNVSAKNIPKPSSALVSRQLEIAVKNYIITDLNPIVTRVEKTGDPNKLGVALVRAMRYSEAKNAFARSNSASAYNNIANIYVIEQNYEAAMAQYHKVLEMDPENKVALKGLESLATKLGN